MLGYNPIAMYIGGITLLLYVLGNNLCSMMLSIFCIQEFDFDVDALFEHLFSIDSDVMKQIYESRKMLSKTNFFFCNIYVSKYVLFASWK